MTIPWILVIATIAVVAATLLYGVAALCSMAYDCLYASMLRRMRRRWEKEKP